MLNKNSSILYLHGEHYSVLSYYLSFIDNFPTPIDLIKRYTIDLLNPDRLSDTDRTRNGWSILFTWKRGSSWKLVKKSSNTSFEVLFSLILNLATLASPHPARIAVQTKHKMFFFIIFQLYQKGSPGQRLTGPAKSLRSQSPHRLKVWATVWQRVFRPAARKSASHAAAVLGDGGKLRGQALVKNTGQADLAPLP